MEARKHAIEKIPNVTFKELMMSFLAELRERVAQCIYRPLNAIVFQLKNVECRTSSRNIRGSIRLRGSGYVLIQSGARLNSGLRYNPIGGDTNLTIVCRGGGRVLVGRNAGLSNCTIVSSTTVEIADNALIGGSVKIYDTDFHSLDPDIRRQENSKEIQGASVPVLISRNAFVGAHSIILKGVTVGENSIVGAGSVVTRDIPSNQIWAGNPARYIRDV